MTVAEFLAKAEALKAKGMMAMMSSDLTVVRSEIQPVTTAYRADVDAAQAKGIMALGFSPSKGQVKLSLDVILADFVATPKAAQKRTMVRAGLYAIMAERFPCR